MPQPPTGKAFCEFTLFLFCGNSYPNPLFINGLHSIVENQLLFATFPRGNLLHQTVEKQNLFCIVPTETMLHKCALKAATFSFNVTYIRCEIHPTSKIT